MARRRSFGESGFSERVTTLPSQRTIEDIRHFKLNGALVGLLSSGKQNSANKPFDVLRNINLRRNHHSQFPFETLR